MGRDPEEPLTETAGAIGPVTRVTTTASGLADTGRRRRLVTRALLLGDCWLRGPGAQAIGLDLGDGSHVVGLGMRLAQGDLPLADEMNLQALGSLPAAPFVWVWLHLVGNEGVILASRVSFVVLAALAGWVSWRALRPMVGPAVAGGAVVAALIPAPYNLTTISYNTSPNLLLLVAASAGARAAQSTDGRWAAGAGVAAVLAALCNPVMAPAAGLTLVLVVLLSRRRQVLVGCSLGVAASAALVATWLIVVVGVEHVRSTLDFTAAYQAQRISHSTRLHNAWEFYATTFSSTPVRVAVALAVLASLPPLPIRLRALLVAVVPLVLAPTAVREIPAGAQAEVPVTGMTSGVLALVLVGVLLLPAAVWAVQTRGARRPASGGDRASRADRVEASGPGGPEHGPGNLDGGRCAAGELQAGRSGCPAGRRGPAFGRPGTAHQLADLVVSAVGGGRRRHGARPVRGARRDGVAGAHGLGGLVGGRRRDVDSGAVRDAHHPALSGPGAVAALGSGRQRRGYRHPHEQRHAPV